MNKEIDSLILKYKEMIIECQARRAEHRVKIAKNEDGVDLDLLEHAVARINGAIKAYNEIILDLEELIKE